MRLMLMMVLMLLAAASHAQPVAAPTPPVQAPAAIRNADDASEKSKLEAAAEAKKLDGAESARQRKLADEKLARTEAKWKKVMGSICTGCVPRSKPRALLTLVKMTVFVTKAVSG